MKATIDFDEQLYRRLKVEAARRGRTVRELVADGVRRVLDAPADTKAAATWRPIWLGALERQARAVDDHAMDAVRASIARHRSNPVPARSLAGKRPATRKSTRLS